jgi:hypothetical protein
MRARRVYHFPRNRAPSAADRVFEETRSMSSRAIGVIREPSVHPASLAASISSGPASPPSLSPAAASTAETPSAFAAVLRGIGREVQHGESLVRSALGAARSGVTGGMQPGELIALQAGVYRYGEAVDLASRLVDRATSSVKTVLQGQ